MGVVGVSSAVLIVVAVALAAVWLPILATLPATFRLQVAAFLLAAQIQLPHVSIGVGYVWCVAVLPAGLLLNRQPRGRLSLWFWALAAVSAAALTYSPNRHLALGGTTRLLVLALIAATVENTVTAETREKMLAAVMRPVAAVAAVEAVTTIWFRVAPATERRYLTSSASHLFLGDLGQSAYTTNLNNVRFPFRAGGLLYVNANRAALFLGVVLLVAVFLYRRGYGRAWLLLAGLQGVAVLATGSKTGLVLLIAVPLCVAYYLRLTDGRSHAPLLTATPVYLAGMGLAAVYLAAAVTSGQIDPVTGASHTAGTAISGRFAIWAHLGQLAPGHILAGVGYGGWQHVTAQLTGVAAGLPPQNLFVSTWADTGLPGLALTVGFIVAAFRRFRPSRVVGDGPGRAWAACAVGVLLWVLLHGQGDNTDLYGVAALIPIFAVLLAAPGGYSPVVASKIAASNSSKAAAICRS